MGAGRIGLTHFAGAKVRYFFYSANFLLYILQVLPAKSLRRQNRRNGIIRKTEQERVLEAELSHHTYALCHAVLATHVLTHSEVVFSSHLDTWCDVPK